MVSWSEIKGLWGETEGVMSDNRLSLSERVINIRTRTVKTQYMLTTGRKHNQAEHTDY